MPDPGFLAGWLCLEIARREPSPRPQMPTPGLCGANRRPTERSWPASSPREYARWRMAFRISPQKPSGQACRHQIGPAGPNARGLAGEQGHRLRRLKPPPFLRALNALAYLAMMATFITIYD
jgi:hypothetical protein